MDALICNNNVNSVNLVNVNNNRIFNKHFVNVKPWCVNVKTMLMSYIIYACTMYYICINVYKYDVHLYSDVHPIG